MDHLERVGFVNWLGSDHIALSTHQVMQHLGCVEVLASTLRMIEPSAKSIQLADEARINAPLQWEEFGLSLPRTFPYAFCKASQKLSG